MKKATAVELLRSGEEGIREWNAAWSDVVLLKNDKRRFNLAGVDFSDIDLSGVNLTDTDLSGVNFYASKLSHAKFTYTILDDADFSRSTLNSCIFSFSTMKDTRFFKSTFGLTVINNINLCESKFLEHADHLTYSEVGVRTLSRSMGRIPEPFLRGCGLAPWEILQTRLYDPTLTPPQFVEIQYKIIDSWTKGKDMINGCFISYSWSDSDFAEKLREKLMSEGIVVWMDKHDMVAGTLQDQVWKAIQVQHVAIIVLSETSIHSDWVENELEMARDKEKAESRPILCPVALDDSWESWLKAADNPNRALWRTLGQKLILDFSSWKTKAFNGAFERLVRGLRTNYGPNPSS